MFEKIMLSCMESNRYGALAAVMGAALDASRTLTITRGKDCLYISEIIRVAGKLQGMSREICTIPGDLRIMVV